MLRTLCLALVALATPIPVHALDSSLPEMELAPSGACRTLAVRDRAKGTMVPIGCLDSGARGFVSTADASDMKVAPSPSAASGTLSRFLASPTFVRGDVFENRTASPLSSYGGFVYQDRAVRAAEILGPQQPPGWFTHDGIRSTIVAQPDAKAQTTSAFGFYARADAPESVTGVTGVFGTSVAAVDHSAVWGFNPTVIDSTSNGVVTSGVGRKLIGIEVDVSVTSPNTIVSGINVTGSSIAQPAGADAFQVGDLWAANPGLNKWSHGLTIGDATSKIGLQIGANSLSGNSMPGIPNYFNFRDAAGALRAVVLQTSGSGGLNVSRADGANGVALVPTAAGVSPTLQAFGTDTNVNLSIKGQGTGQVIVQSSAIFNGAVTFGGAVIASQPVKLPVYTVANLPTCNAAALGSMAAVSDATAPTYNGALTGGGTVPIPVFCRGDVWLAH